ncbi:MAG: hypothetical protein ACRD12_07975 [Acidimicrobiales bacterium]
MSAGDQCRILSLRDFVASTGVGYDEGVVALAGGPVVVEGALQRTEEGELLLGTGGVECAHATPQPTLLLTDPSESLELVSSGTPVRLLGVLEYGLEVGDGGTATYLRLRSARPC